MFGEQIRKKRDYTHLLPLPTTHGWWFCVLVVNICPEILGKGLRRLLSLFDSLVNLCLGLLVELLRVSNDSNGQRWLDVRWVKSAP